MGIGINLLIITTVFGALASYAITNVNKKIGAWFAAIISGAVLIFSYLLIGSIGETSTLSILTFKITEIGWYFMIVVAITYFATALFNPYWMDKLIDPAAYNMLYILSLAGTMGLFFAEDFISLFIFWEIVVWSSMFIVPFGKSRRAAVLYYAISAFGSFSMLYAILYLGTRFNTFNIQLLLNELSNYPALAGIMFFIMVLSGLTKLGIFPFHVWLPAAHSSAPHTFSPVLSGGLVKMGAYMVFLVSVVMPSLKVFVGHFHILGMPFETYILMILSAISIVIGTLMAIKQDDAKKLLAYSSVANGGYIMIGILMADQFGLAGSLMHIFNHAVATAAAFLSIAAVAYRTGTTKMSELGGMIHRMPVTYVVYLMSIISLAGIPPMGGFESKWRIFQSLASHGLIFVAAAAFFGSIGSFLYVFRPLSGVFLGQLSPRHEGIKEAPAPMLFGMIFLQVFVLFFGVMPQGLLNIIGKIQTAYGIPAVQSINNVITAVNGKLDTVTVFFVFGFGFMIALVLFLLLPKSKKVGLMDTYTSAEFIHTPELLHYSYDFYAFIERLYEKHPSTENLYNAVSERIRDFGNLATYLFFSHRSGVTVFWTAAVIVLILVGGVAI